MPQKPKNPHGIFCLETIWFDERSNPSTRSLLELLERLRGVPFVYRDVSTWEEMDFCLGRWVGRSTYKKDYQLGDLGILYLGFHGSPGEISLREDLSHRHDEDEVDLARIGNSLTCEDNRYDCSGSVIHFASCSVLRAPARAEELRKQVGAACVSGYTKSVEPTTSWAFELMYLALLSKLLIKRNVNASTLGTLEKKDQLKARIQGSCGELRVHDEVRQRQAVDARCRRSGSLPSKANSNLITDLVLLVMILPLVGWRVFGRRRVGGPRRGLAVAGRFGLAAQAPPKPVDPDALRGDPVF